MRLRRLTSRADAKARPSAGAARSASRVPLMRRLIRIVFLLGLSFLAASMAVVVLYRVLPPPATPLMLIRAAQGYGMTKAWRPLEQISPNLVRAVIAGEDARFCEHHGFDWDAIGTAWERYRRGRGRLVGASTISMQTAKNLFLWPGRDWLRKALEAWFTALARAGLEQAADYRGLSEHRRMGLRHLRRRGRRAPLFRQACGGAERARGGAPGRRVARSARPLGEKPRPGRAAARSFRHRTDAAAAGAQSAALRRAIDRERTGTRLAFPETSLRREVRYCCFNGAHPLGPERDRGYGGQNRKSGNDSRPCRPALDVEP